MNIWTIFVATIALASSAHAIFGGVAPAPDDHRFDAVCQITTQQNLSDFNGVSGTGTLISPTEILMAKHSWGCPNGQHAARFRINPGGQLGDPNVASSYFHVNIVSFDTSLPGDVVIGILEAPVSHIQPIPLGFGANPQEGDPLFVAGWGRPSDRLRYMSKVVQTISDCNIGFPAIGPPSAECNQCEIRAHDSGAPVLWFDGTQLVIVHRAGRPDYLFANPPFECLVLNLAPGQPVVPPVNDLGYCATDLDGDGNTDLNDQQIVIFNLNNGDCVDCTNCPGDANGDCTRNIADLLAISVWWGSCGCPGDINGDAAVDLLDLNDFLAHFGECLICAPATDPCDVSPPPTISQDLNRDGRVDLNDLNLLLANFGCDHGM